MNYFFSPVSVDTLIDMSQDDLDTLFYNEGGEAFWFNIEIEEDTFVITDTVGRIMPFDVDQSKALFHAVLAVESAYEVYAEANEVLQDGLDEIDATLVMAGYPTLQA